MSSLSIVILAAGTSSRMGELAKNGPKATFDVAGHPLIFYMIRFARMVRPDAKIIVVGGYKFDILRDIVKKIDPEVIVVENSQFLDQNLYSLYRATSFTEGSLLVCNADYIFTKDHAKRVSQQLSELSVFSSFDLSGNDEDVARVQTDGLGNLIKLSKNLEKFDGIYTGLFFVPEAIVGQLSSIIEAIWLKYSTQETTVEYLFPELLDMGEKIKCVDIGKSNWLEMDTPEELLRARENIKAGIIDFV